MSQRTNTQQCLMSDGHAAHLHGFCASHWLVMGDGARKVLGDAFTSTDQARMLAAKRRVARMLLERAESLRKLHGGRHTQRRS